MSAEKSTTDGVAKLEAAYGPPSQAAFGSAVFTAKLDKDRDLEQVARETYRSFVGGLWERYGEEAWMGPWKQVYARQDGATADIVGELRGIADQQAATSVPMILDEIDSPEAARAALVAVYDDSAVTDLRVFSIGDGEAMSGLLIASARAATGVATFLVFLMD